MGLTRREICGVSVPDTPLVMRAMEEARTLSEPYLFNHAVRSWLFAALIAKSDGVQHDEEVVAVGTLLHDIGLTKNFVGERRFEVEGADGARTFAREHAVDGRRAQLIWYCVAMNATPSLSFYAEPEVALGTIGVSLDFAGQLYDRVPKDVMASILKAYPRLQMKHQFTERLCDIARASPQTTYDNFIRDFGERFVAGYRRRTSFVDLLSNAQFDE